MRSRLCHLSLVLALVLLSFVPSSVAGQGPVGPKLTSNSPGAATTRAVAPDGFFGVVIRDPYYEMDLTTQQVRRDFIDAMVQNVVDSGAKWIRFEFHATWDTANGGYGIFHLSQADYLIERAHARGLKVLALINTGILRGPGEELWNFNDFPAAMEYCRPTLGCGLTPYMEHFLTRSLQIASYYRGRIDAYEILNEPNRYYGLVASRAERGQPYQDELNPERVARTIAQFYQILRQHGDRTPVVIGGIHPASSTQTGRSDVQYIEALYRSSAFQAHKNSTGRWPADGLAYHPYAQELSEHGLSNDEFLSQASGRIQQVLATVRAYDSSIKLWITEIGAQGNYADGPSMQDQAQFLAIFFELAWHFRHDIATVMWFKHEDWSTGSPAGKHQESWGFVHIPHVYQEGSRYPDPWRYDADLKKWSVKPAFLVFRDRALNGIPVVQQ